MAQVVRTALEQHLHPDTSVIESIFTSVDVDGIGLLPRAEVIEMYRNLEFFGQAPTTTEIERIFARFGGPGSCTIDQTEFVMLISDYIGRI